MVILDSGLLFGPPCIGGARRHRGPAARTIHQPDDGRNGADRRGDERRKNSRRARVDDQVCRQDAVNRPHHRPHQGRHTRVFRQRRRRHCAGETVSADEVNGNENVSVCGLFFELSYSYIRLFSSGQWHKGGRRKVMVAPGRLSGTLAKVFSLCYRPIFLRPKTTFNMGVLTYKSTLNRHRSPIKVV